MRLLGRTVVITGGASGVGAATTRKAAAEGARVALVDLQSELLSRLAVELENAGHEVLAIPADVSLPAAAHDGVTRVMRAWGRIDVLMAAAGISTGGTVTTIEPTQWEHVFDVNVKGAYLWARESIPQMTTGRGVIVFVGSQLAISSVGGNAAYIASKGAIVSLTRTMAVDHAGAGIRVNALMPGVIDTPMSRASLARSADPQSTRARWARRHAMGRFGRPEEVANAALFLMSDDSSFTTGSLLFVDGGWTAL